MGEAPVIREPPVSRLVNRMESALFSVAASGDPAPQYQWRHNEIDLPNATNAALLLTNVTLPQAGNYSVRVSNLVEVVTSGAAQLVVTDDRSWFASFTLLSGGGLQMQGVSPFNKQLVIQTTTNLSEVPIQWVPLHTNDGSLGSFDFTDPNALNCLQRFYRTVHQP